MENGRLKSQIKSVDHQGSRSLLETHQWDDKQDKLRSASRLSFKKYDDYYAPSKVLNFTKGFLKYQAKLTLDPRFLAFDMFLDKPRVRKIKKKMTACVVTKEDVEHVLAVNQRRDAERRDR